MIGLRFTIVLVLAFGLLLAPRWWRARRIADQRDRAPLPALPASLRRESSRTWIVFTTRFCAQCGPLAEWLRTARHGDDVVLVDAEREPLIAEQYRVRSTPTVLVADPSGRVHARLVGTEAVRAYAS